MTKELVFVYGTLKRDGCNSSVMKKALGVYKCKALTLPVYDMISLGGFPSMVMRGNKRVAGEAYEVENIEPIDFLEGFPSFYDRRQINLTLIYKPTPRKSMAWAYFINSIPKDGYREGIEENNGVVWWNNKYME